MCGDVKPSLIDLEVGDTTTGRKHTLIMQRERLSERGTMYCVYWIRKETHSDIFNEGYVGISKNFKERMRQHKKNKKKTPLTGAIQKYSWNQLVKEILYDSLTQEEALTIEGNLRKVERIGWNLQRGGYIGVDSSWYEILDNKIQHSKATSEQTKIGIQKKDTKEKRVERAKTSWATNRDSYKDICKGSKNPKALLTEDDVHFIKYTLIPSGMSNLELGPIFNVKPYVISFIRTNKNWKHI
jgi:predicted GIY-YIG superfamily endonuclease